MTTFKYDLAIKGGPERLQSIHDKLVAIGRVRSHYKAGKDCVCLVTNHCGDDGMAFFVDLMSCYDRLSFNESEEELILAVAAMTEGDRPIIGEYCVALYTLEGFEEGKLYKLEADKDAYHEFKTTIKDSTQVGDLNGWHKGNFSTYWRKATLEEIREWFSKSEETAQNPIRYELKKEYVGLSIFGHYECFAYGSLSHQFIKKSGILDSHYDAIYPVKEITKKLHSWSGLFDVIITKECIITENGNVVPVGDLTSLVNHFRTKFKVGPWQVYYGSSFVDIGCKKGISVSALADVLDAYESLQK